MSPLDFDQRVARMRRFNRAYTQRIGVLNEGLLESSYTLAQVRVLYELAHRKGPTASELVADLRLDPGYLSRILRNFDKQGLVARSSSRTDRRRAHLRLTVKGRKVFAPLDDRSRADIAGLLSSMPERDQDRLIQAVDTIERVFAEEDMSQRAYVLRPHGPGDMGWVVQRHGALYWLEYGWNTEFEALVAEIVAQFIRRFDPAREHCWIADRNGERLGSVFLVKQSATVAKLRLLLVEPRARGLGLGRLLVDECTAFARQAGYKRLTLWTNSVLLGARRIYERAGYTLVKEEPHESFGKRLVGQNWELKL
jgi:DNA-binding MarR family transcriptional regulator/N-acetylglutamate synthase-like GNAT family acetyltransferase